MRQSHSVSLAASLLLSFLTVLLTAPAVQVANVQASPETIVKVDPSTISVNVSDTFTVNITVVDIQNLYSVEVTLNWNSSVLELEEVDIRIGQSDGVLNNPFSIVENSTQTGRYTLAALSYEPAPSFNGTGNVVTLTFKAKDSGDSRLDLESQLYDYPPLDRYPPISEPIAHTTLDGFYSAVLPEIPSGVIFMSALILTTLTVFVLKKVLKKPGHAYGLVFHCGNQRLLAVNMLHRERAGT